MDASLKLETADHHHGDLNATYLRNPSFPKSTRTVFWYASFFVFFYFGFLKCDKTFIIIWNRVLKCRTKVERNFNATFWCLNLGFSAKVCFVSRNIWLFNNIEDVLYYFRCQTIFYYKYLNLMCWMFKELSLTRIIFFGQISLKNQWCHMFTKTSLILIPNLFRFAVGDCLIINYYLVVFFDVIYKKMIFIRIDLHFIFFKPFKV